MCTKSRGKIFFTDMPTCVTTLQRLNWNIISEAGSYNSMFGCSLDPTVSQLMSSNIVVALGWSCGWRRVKLVKRDEKGWSLINVPFGLSAWTAHTGSSGLISGNGFANVFPFQKRSTLGCLDFHVHSAVRMQPQERARKGKRASKRQKCTWKQRPAKQNWGVPHNIHVADAHNKIIASLPLPTIERVFTYFQSIEKVSSLTFSLLPPQRILSTLLVVLLTRR